MKHTAGWSAWRILEWLGFKLNTGEYYLIGKHAFERLIGKFHATDTKIKGPSMEHFYWTDWIGVPVSRQESIV